MNLYVGAKYNIKLIKNYIEIKVTSMTCLLIIKRVTNYFPVHATMSDVTILLFMFFQHTNDEEFNEEGKILYDSLKITKLLE